MNDPVKAKIIELVPDIKNSDIFESIPTYRPITLADVLRVVTDKFAISLGEGRFSLAFGDIHFSDVFTVKSFTWNLFADYDNQTDEVKAFIGKLLGVNP
jgi:hypothetical protein